MGAVNKQMYTYLIIYSVVRRDLKTWKIRQWINSHEGDLAILYKVMGEDLVKSRDWRLSLIRDI